MNTQNKLLNIKEVSQLIADNRVLVIAGDETILSQLPKGNWIGGTIPYFMGHKGGEFSQKRVFVFDVSDLIQSYNIKLYEASELEELTTDTYQNGFSYLLLPGLSKVLAEYALKAETMPGIYDNPIFGWVTGIDLEKLGKQQPKVFDGSTGKSFNEKALVMHCKLQENKIAALDIINIFNQGDGDEITFPEEGFESSVCYVDGIESNFPNYIKAAFIDTRLPLVANYSGALINISFLEVDEKNNKVSFYAPVRKDTVYKVAAPIESYVEEFKKYIPKNSDKIVTSCNCILNYLYSELEGKKTGTLAGPITFGEIAYVLVNQTLVYLSIHER